MATASEVRAYCLIRPIVAWVALVEGPLPVVERFAKPAVFGAVANGNPSWNGAGFIIWILCWLKTDWRFLAALQFESLKEFPVTDHATRSIPLSRGETLTGQDPLRSRND